jgi:Transposase DDE domain group 1
VTAWVTERTGKVNLPDWPDGTRLICRRERPHPRAQMSFTDLDGHRFQCFITDQTTPDIAQLEATHRQHAVGREDRVKTLKTTGANYLPFHSFQANATWFELALCAHDIMIWTQLLCLDGEHGSQSPNACATVMPTLRACRPWLETPRRLRGSRGSSSA